MTVDGENGRGLCRIHGDHLWSKPTPARWNKWGWRYVRSCLRCGKTEGWS